MAETYKRYYNVWNWREQKAKVDFPEEGQEDMELLV